MPSGGAFMTCATNRFLIWFTVGFFAPSLSQNRHYRRTSGSGGNGSLTFSAASESKAPPL